MLATQAEHTQVGEDLPLCELIVIKQFVVGLFLD